MLTLYKAFVRPHLEYAPQVWDPHLIKDVELLERTQKESALGNGLHHILTCWNAAKYLLFLIGANCVTSNKIIYGLVDCAIAQLVQK